jgi:hypothetical protein
MKVRRIRQSLLAVVVATGALVGTTALFSTAASASYPLSTNCGGGGDCGTSSAFGVSVGLAGNVLVPPTPSQTLPTGGGAQPPANLVSIPANPLISVNAVSANAYSTGTFGSANENIWATSAVSGLTTESGISVLNTIEATAVTTTCTSNAAGSVAQANFLGLNIAGMAIPDVVPINDVLPSTELGPLAPLLTVELNAQTNLVNMTGQTGTTVDGIVITVLGTGVVIVVAQSVCEANGPDILPPPTAPPAVTSVSPSSGGSPGGEVVLIDGSNLGGATAVDFGPGNPATLVADSAGQIEARDPSGTAGTTVNVTVTTPGGTSAINAGDQFTYTTVSAPAPVVTSISPTSGPNTGGNTVTINGTNLQDADAVAFADTQATILTDTSTDMTVTAPAGTSGTTVDVTVTTPSGTSAISPSDKYTYNGTAVSGPTINSNGISPLYGPTSGGTLVTILGTNFTPAAGVTFGGTAATSINYVNSGELQAVTPAHAAGAVSVVVTTTSGSATAAQAFTYVGAPTITTISPTSGPTSGGTTVTITGSGFGGATSVTFGSLAATGVTVVSSTEITAITPAQAAGAVPVSLSDIGGSATAGQQYTYVAGPPAAPVPTLLGISPTSGPQSGGETVIIGGQNLCGATSVTFGPNSAPIQSISSDCTTIKVTEPAGNGTVPVIVTTPGGSAESPVPFTYIQPGYWMAASDGGVFAFGGARFYGSVPGVLKPGQSLNSPIVAMADTPDHGGYWLFAGDGGVFAFGDAQFYGSVPGVLKPHQVLNGPIVAAEATPDGHGYRMFAADGGVFDFGDAVFEGSLPGENIIPDQPITAAVSTPIGQGYWLSSQDGGVYTFGNAVFNGSAAGQIFGKVTSMASMPDGLGYYMFLANGPVAVEGDAVSGLGGANDPVAPIVFGQATSTGQGYWEFATDGGVFTFGDAPFEGSLGGTHLNAPITAAIAFGSN